MSEARSRILERLRRSSHIKPFHPNTLKDREAEWQARQPEMGDLKEVFAEELAKVGSKVIRVPDWQALPQAVTPWFKEYRVSTAITGDEPRLEPLRKHLAKNAGVEIHTFSGTLEVQKEEIFSMDCGITTSRGGIADTGSVLMLPSAAEPRLLSLAVPIHLVVVDSASLFPTLGAYLDTGEFQANTPSNLVLISGASRTADIELTLAVGVHGPKELLVALVG